MRTRREGQPGAEPLSVLALAFKAVGLGLGAVSIVLVALRVSSLETDILLLSIGLVALALGTIIETVALGRALEQLPRTLEETLRRVQRPERGGRRRR